MKNRIESRNYREIRRQEDEKTQSGFCDKKIKLHIERKVIQKYFNLTKSEKQFIREALKEYGTQMNEIGCGADYGSEYLELVERFR